MISKQELKFIKSLHSKKHRTEAGLFLVEGEKSLAEVLQSSWEVKMVLATTEFLHHYIDSKNKSKTKIFEADTELLRKTGSLSSNDAGLAVVRIPDTDNYYEPANRLVLAVENIRDPGNLGTLLRIADWYGIKELLLSKESADIFNPKVIQSSMGSFLRVKVFYCDLKETFRKKKIPLFGTFTAGDNIYNASLPSRGYILLGNESQGISNELSALVDRRLSIPKFGKAESLNVAVAAAVVLDNFKRK